MIIKLTKPYILEGIQFNEGTELIIVSDGETEEINATADEPEKEVDFGIVPNEEK